VTGSQIFLSVAVACVLMAGVASILSLLLPYWSEMQLNVASQDHLELTFGLWGSCINLEPKNQAKLDSPVMTNGSEVIAIAPESAASETLTCGSFFDEERVRITCTSFRQLASGQCTRRDFHAESSLCDAEAATAFLGGGVKSETVSSWLRFLEMACGRVGRASIVFAVLCSIFTGLAGVLLFFGITCARIDSCIGKIGAACSASTAVFQLIMAALWDIETGTINGERVAFGTSFYLNSACILLHSIAFFAAKKHHRLEHEAHREHLGDDLEEVKQATQKKAEGKTDDTHALAAV
jgi:hypothetical protein